MAERYAEAPERPTRRSRRCRASRSGRCIRRRICRGRGGEIGLPGEFPFTRGVYPSMYRGRLWTMRQFAGFGTAEETNERFRYLLDHGQTGLSTAFDMPSLMGHDSDHARQLGRGRAGRAWRSTRSMTWRRCSRGSISGEVSVSMTINAPAAIMMAFYVVAAEEKGVPRGPAGGDGAGGHPEGVHRAEGVVFPGRSGDAPAGGHDAVVHGAHAALASGLDLRLSHPRGGLDGRAGAGVHAQGRPDLCRRSRSRAGWTSTTSRRGLRFFFNAHIDFFEEIAKYRAARRIWARELRDTFGAKQREVVADALPHADGRGVADGAAAAQQHRPHRDRGARGGAGRDAVAAYQLA